MKTSALIAMNQVALAVELRLVEQKDVPTSSFIYLFFFSSFFLFFFFFRSVNAQTHAVHLSAHNHSEVAPTFFGPIFPPPVSSLLSIFIFAVAGYMQPYLHSVNVPAYILRPRNVRSSLPLLLR